MFLYQLFLIGMAYSCIHVAEGIFPQVQSDVYPELYSSLWTVLVFRPFHLVMSLLLFSLGFFIIRSLTIKAIQMIMTKSKIDSRTLGGNLLLLILGWLIVGSTLVNYPIPTLLITGVLGIMDIVQWIANNRRTKRIKTALRELQ